ncbi:hypothetical protein SUGI_1189470 [Cryptomeria japonica]|nr:hypothetical protein SUGI_1189470 [Cryptomeria japonica]
MAPKSTRGAIVEYFLVVDLSRPQRGSSRLLKFLIEDCGVKNTFTTSIINTQSYALEGSGDHHEEHRKKASVQVIQTYC